MTCKGEERAMQAVRLFIQLPKKGVRERREERVEVRVRERRQKFILREKKGLQIGSG